MGDKIILYYPKVDEEKDFHYAPFSILAVAAPLAAAGFEMLLIDERVDIEPMAKLEKALMESNYVLISAYSGYQVSRAFKVSEYIRKIKATTKIIWGGPHATALPEQTVISEMVDIVSWGYAESSIVELMQTLTTGKPLLDVPNIYFKDKDNEGKIVVTQKNPHFDNDNMSRIPFELVDLNKYINPDSKRFIYISSYGCPGRCTFCATKNGRKWITIDIKKVKADIEYLMNQHDYKECVFFDATLFTLPQRAKEIANIMKNYNIQWIADARAPEIIKLDDEAIDELISSGLKQLTVGLESGAQNVVNIMKKGEKHLQHFRKAAELLSRHRVKMVSGVIFGCIGETMEDLYQTLDYIKEIKNINPNFFVSSTFFRPLPNTELYDTVISKGYYMPQSLPEWAEVGGSNHYTYNQWTDNPWLNEIDIKKYREVYEKFREDNKDIFI